MLGTILRIAATVLVGTVLLYLSRFWPFELWSRPGLFGQRALPPGGDALRIWLRGTPFASASVPIWVCVVFVVLSLTEKLTGSKSQE